MGTPTGVKHLLTCNCVMRQFIRSKDPPVHRFIVFSVLEDDRLKEHFAQCNNCGVVHKVTDVCKSTIMIGKDDTTTVRTIDDIKFGLSPNIVQFLERSDADLATWQAVEFYVENKMWNSYINITSESDGTIRQGKCIRLLGESLFKVESYVRNETV